MSKPDYLNTKIFLDSGDPLETERVKQMLGFLDGQTTNPSLVAKNPHIKELKEKGELTTATIWEKYQEVANEIHSIIPDGSISVEVYADNATAHETMLVQGRELSQWFPGIFVKLPTTKTGLSVAKVLSGEGININMTLCFSQEQAAAVHMATLGAAKGKVYVSPFIGRLDDIGINGLDLIKNILQMYKEWGSHVMLLGASIRSLEHLFYCINSGADIITAPLPILESWTKYGLDKNPADFGSPELEADFVSPEDYSVLSKAEAAKKPIEYKNLPQQDWTLYNIHHDLTDKGIEKFSTDWKGLFSK